jgi:DNA-directed RNA polymerase specialized sigma24 family protein
LPPAYRTVVILRHIQGMSYEEISKVTNLPMGTVKSRLGRGRCRLTTLLQDKI